MDDMARYGQMWPDMPDMARYGQIWPDMVDMARYGQIWPDILDMARYGQILPDMDDMARYGQDIARYVQKWPEAYVNPCREPMCILPVFYRINWQYTHRSEWRRLAVPCGRAGSASNAHYDQDILASVTVCKKNPRFPFHVKIGLCRPSFYPVKHG